MPKKSEKSSVTVEELSEQVAELQETVAMLQETLTNLSLSKLIISEKDKHVEEQKELVDKLQTSNTELAVLKEDQERYLNKDEELAEIQADIKNIEKFLRGKKPEDMKEYFGRQEKLEADLRVVKKLKDMSSEIKKKVKEIEALEKELTKLNSESKIVDRLTTILELE